MKELKIKDDDRIKMTEKRKLVDDWDIKIKSVICTFYFYLFIEGSEVEKTAGVLKGVYTLS